MWLTLALWLSAAIATAYLVYPALCRRSATRSEARASLAGDDLVPVPSAAHTLAITIGASPAEVWHELARLDPARHELVPGDRLWLPAPQARRHHVLVVTAVAEHTLVLLQALPAHHVASWAFVLRERGDATRMVFRYRAIGRRRMQRLESPALHALDHGMLKSIKRRAERAHSVRLVHRTAA